jgi:hypothetical protein
MLQLIVENYLYRPLLSRIQMPGVQQCLEFVVKVEFSHATDLKSHQAIGVAHLSRRE